ncbi:hypothetical protein DPMN_001202 [Dreissena polymorpha]|uniref:LRAT domain-containing protein n=1 Tax=Dreissena polymorpha TaxID=45954 RepID=A0A9D4MJV3_DREPO|nr:hypothetical protein DPMN_001202 [Dreissena polymorpha]
MECQCGNSTLKQYLDTDDDTIIGFNCPHCEQEWLTNGYYSACGEPKAKLVFNRQEYFQQENVLEKEQEVFQVRGSRTEFGQNDWRTLQPGDHITWHRPYIIWHHAIVLSVDEGKKQVLVIHWTTAKDDQTKYEVVEEWLIVEEQSGTLYRIDYPKEVTDKNSAKLVLSRARSKLGETKYNLMANNCESLASFCKTGVSESCQVRWLWGKLKETANIVNAKIYTSVPKVIATLTVQETLESAVGLTLAEGVEKVSKASNYVGAGIVVVIEGAHMVWDLSKMYERRQDGKLTRKDFIESSTQRFMEALCAAGLAIVGSLGGEALGGTIGGVIGSAMPVIGTAVGAAVGVFIGSIIGGALGAISGRAFGSLLGPFVGKAITSLIKRDDKAVRVISDIFPGDQIIFCPWFLHPRCHAIVVKINKDENTVKVIRSSYAKGVVEEWRDFCEPIYKVMYNESDTYDPEVSISRARSKLGQNEYSLLTNNCKHFACWCKEKDS